MSGPLAPERRIPDEVLDAPVTGVPLMPGTLRDQLGGSELTLLVFLVRRDRIVWTHKFRHAGDLPDFGAVAARARDHRERAGVPG